MIRVKGGGDELMLQLLDAGAEDIESDDQDGSVESIVYTDMKDLAKVRDALKDAGVEIMEAELTYVPNNTVEVTDQATAGKIMRIMDALESIDDVSNTHVNFDIDESLL